MSLTILMSTIEEEVTPKSLAKTAARVVVRSALEEFVTEIILPIIQPYIHSLVQCVKTTMIRYNLLQHEHAT